MSLRVKRYWRGALALAAFGICLAAAATEAENAPSLKLHSTLEGDSRPLLCKDQDTVGLVVSVLGRAIDARTAGDADKAKRLFEIAAKLENEICLKPAADDIVILRCNLGQKSFGDTQISLVKISALLRSNSSAGEQPFYGWTYAGIAPSDAGDATAQDADKRWCSEQQQTVADAPLDPTPDLIQRIQQRFYDFGFNIPNIDGQLNQETIQSLVAFQKWAGLPATGQLTKLTVDKIDATQAPSSWVAIAFDAWGNNNMVTGATRRSAEADALGGLRRRSRSNYHIDAVAYPNCMALSVTRYGGRRQTFTQAFTNAGNTEASAEQNALDSCNRQKGGGTCQVRNSLCASGTGQQPQRYDPSQIPVNAQVPPGGGASRYDPNNEPLNAPAPGVGAAPSDTQGPGTGGAPDSDNQSQPADASGDKSSSHDAGRDSGRDSGRDGANP